MIDAIGPFFRGYDKSRVNWSKIPFEHLERDGALDAERMQIVRDEFQRFVLQVSRMGFNAISIDNLAHMVNCEDYPRALRAKIENYRCEYETLFAMAEACGLDVYVTTDVMFYNSTLYAMLGHDHKRILAFLKEKIAGVFHDFPQIKGIIVRVGESDGVDVAGDFRSRLTIRTPREARRYLRELLPVFERNDRHLIFRTWSVGAYRIGDLIWNRETLWETFKGIDSQSLIISLKYGESDFFRHLPLNKQFFRSKHQKIVELQARREYEGFGEYPSFVGYDYAAYHDQLKELDHVVGTWVWCQTGGWSHFRRLTFLDEDAVWSGLNTVVTQHIFKDGMTVDEAVEAYRREYLPDADGPKLREFLRLSDEVIKELLYIPDFSRRKIFFRRTRVPPLLWVYWDNILITHALRKLLRCFEVDGEASVRQARAALQKIRHMAALSIELGLPRDDIDFQYDAFEIMAAAREYYFMPFEQSTREHLQDLVTRYRSRHPAAYNIILDLTPLRVKRRHINMLLSLVFREKRGYRLIDHVFTLRLLSLFAPLMKRWSRGWVPDFAEDQAMGMQTLLR
jgi:hypothetical protein